MPRSRSGMVAAKEAIVIVVGARPRKFGRQTVTNRRTNERVEIDYTDSDYENHRDYEPEDPGIPYAFKAYQKVPRSHPAVQQSPHAFVELDDVDEDLLVNA